MILVYVELFGKKLPVLASGSFVYVNHRVLNVSVYRRLDSEADVEILRDFTKKWTADIIAANK